MRFRTRAVHVGTEKDPTFGATIPPVYLTTTYTHDKVGKHKGYEYSRTDNPTRKALEKLIASLENAKYGVAFSSGMAATHSVLSLIESGGHLVLSRDVYGGTYRLVNQFLKTRGIDYSLVDTVDINQVKGSIRENTKIIFIETPTNPLLKIMDIGGLKEAAGQHILLVVDNTFATPYYQNPLDLGADVVVHSSTKYLGGHSDVIGGLIVTDKSDLYRKLRFFQNAVGAVPSPFDCYLTTRGIKTLALRMEAHSQNALEITKFLEKHPKVKEVFYPGFSGMASFRIKDGLDASKRFLEKLKVFSLAESLGAVESLACLPKLMTHATFESQLQEELGITPDLIRLSIGVEDKDDLIEDIDQALG